MVQGYLEFAGSDVLFPDNAAGIHGGPEHIPVTQENRLAEIAAVFQCVNCLTRLPGNTFERAGRLASGKQPTQREYPRDSRRSQDNEHPCGVADPCGRPLGGFQQADEVNIPNAPAASADAIVGGGLPGNPERLLKRS
jgi:hypothetical protein